MSENRNNKPARRPVRIVLVAAALVAALGITASAAEIPAVKEFFTSIFVTVTIKGDEANSFHIPSVEVEERDDHTILLVNGEETDITDALAQEKEYLYEGDGFQVQVDENGVAVVTAYGDDGTEITYSAENQRGDTVIYEITTDMETEEGFRVRGLDDNGEGFDLSGYEISTDQNGAVTVFVAEEK